MAIVSEAPIEGDSYEIVNVALKAEQHDAWKDHLPEKCSVHPEVLCR